MEKITNGHPLSQSADIVKENIDTLKSLFPTIVKEGKIDIEELKALLDEEIETNDEYYRFTWAGKNEARKEANKPSTATLRPNKTDSKNWDTTGNIFIEGDNLEVLKLLQKSYAGGIRMMYFDPPYNTGKEFIYPDDYSDNLGNYLHITQQTDELGKKLSTNTESDGRYHSNWLNMMYPRLKLARNLLTDDGILFLSIGQVELSNLIKLCDDIYGEENRVAIVGRLAKSGGNKGKFFSPNIEYLLVLAKNIEQAIGFRDEMNADLVKKVYTQTETSGERLGQQYRAMGLYQSSLDSRANQRYYIQAPDGSFVIPPKGEMPMIKREGEKVIPKNKEDGCWRWTFSKYIEEKEKGNIEFKITNNNVLWDENGQFSKWNVNTKIWLSDREEDGQLPNDFISKFENRHSAKELVELNIPFDFPKPTGLIKYLAKISGTCNSDIILDIFAGSGTTAHSIMQLNSEDIGKRKFICVQLPEPTDEKSEAYKAGYTNIAEICKERIRRAGDKILNTKTVELENLKQSIEGKILQDDVKEQIEQLQSTIDNLDTGFKAFKLDSSNINAWDGSVENFEQNLFNAQNNIKDNRTEEDVLFEILLKYGLDLTVPITLKEVNSCKIYSVGGGVLFVCLSDNITTEVAETIGKWKEELEPAVCRALFKDNGFKDDVAKTNSIQILKQYGIEETNSI